ncbi:peptidase domain-containing ABC transporter [Rhodovulum visakhapatnamense]|uniref:ATP-binding cassette subfamily B protein n=1 Tax=Rhodovulum visakhapatnamense TaxID=364297 RepID=A0A4R8FWJ5_9RHOB|nr:peptidase domain-containing ABC transporter [Rhodovulum visakhapatnamense]TDX31267.1 ATP-binding cassette subfamily B protein [Rhodovulum visakhapatnamense]
MSVHDSQLSETLALDTPQLSTLRGAFLIAAHNGIILSPDELPDLGQDDLAPGLMALFAAKGLRCRLIGKAGWRMASRLGQGLPVLAEVEQGRWIVLVHAGLVEKARTAALLDPRHEADGVRSVPWEEFELRWTGRLILIGRTDGKADAARAFGLRWFLPALRRERSLFAGVAVAVVTGNLIAFSLPLLLQVMIDRVIAHQAWYTLMSVTAVYVLLVLFDAGFGYVRQRLSQIAGGRIDADIGSQSVAHLLRLPMTVFETTPAGVMTRNIQQTDKIRHFLTGRLLQTMLDAALLPLLLTTLALLSGTLTLIIALYAIAIAGCIGLMLPILQSRLNALYGVEAERQALLVETLHNMRAVKSLAVEPARQRLWEDSLAQSVRKQWDLGRISALTGTLTGLLERMMQVTVVAVGVGLALQGTITVGTLVAILLLSGRVSGPLVQIVGLINEWQEAALSIRMLRKIMDHPPERQDDAQLAQPMLSGALELREVGFAYPGAATPALDRVSLSVAPGQVVGIVGRSGSGKTTLTRLIQGIETPQQGLILFDGIDIRNIALSSLRRQVGIVLQDNLLFRGSIRDNIAVAVPGAPLEAVLRAATLAGADEFIRRLPMGFDTMVEESGANLSGGQRQRIAIARALLADPRILILDEATSALDPESEALVNRNLAAIAHGRTMIVVSHRLSSLVRADQILVLDQGRLLDMAPHETLLSRCETYAMLWRQQTEHMA